MNKILRIAVIVTGAFLLMNEAKAQTRYGTNNNTGIQPGLIYYSDRYYYFPEIDIYYDIANRRFIYFENGRWVLSHELSNMYRNYDVNNGYRVLIEETRPYMHADRYRMQYSNYYDAYHGRYRSPEVLPQNRVYNNDHYDNRQQGNYDDRGRTQNQNSMDDRAPIQDRKIQQRNRVQDPGPVDNGKEEYNRIENKSIEDEKSKAPAAANKQEQLKSEQIEEPERIEAHKHIEPGKIQSPNKIDYSAIENGKKEIPAKAVNRAPIEPIKKAPVDSVKLQEPVKTDSIFNSNRSPVKSREAQYSDKFKRNNG